jgi:hypothetical protein
MTKTKTPVASVMQVDREAAADLMLLREKAAGKFPEDETVADVHAEYIRAGLADDQDVVQVFARHRITTTPPAIDDPWRVGIFEQIALFKGPVVSFDVREPYYLASCDACGWIGSTEQCPPSDEDAICPRCLSSGADCGQVAERLASLPTPRADTPVEGRGSLIAALDDVLATSGARGTYHALKYSDAVDRAEALLATIAKARS